MQHIIINKNKTIALPQNINECSGLQLIALVALRHTPKIKPLTAQLFALRVLCNLNMLSWWRLNYQFKAAMLQYVHWVFKELELTAQLLPKYRGFYGVKQELDNLTLSEFYFTELYFSKWNKEDDVHALNMLCAVLYRPGKRGYDAKKDVDGDIRIKFNGNTTEYFAGKIALWPMAVRQSIALFYSGCQAKIAKDNPKIFTAGGGDDNSEADMFGVLRGLAGGKYGTFKDIEEMYLHTALLEMNCLIEDNERMEREAKKTA